MTQEIQDEMRSKRKTNVNVENKSAEEVFINVTSMLEICNENGFDGKGFSQA